MVRQVRYSVQFYQQGPKTDLRDECRKNLSQQQVVIKSVAGRSVVEHERYILQLFNQAPLLRPVIDEIEEPPKPTTIVLQYLDADLEQCSMEKRLNRKELKYVSKKILQALNILHDREFVNTGILILSTLNIPR
jgi:hypothetical protein